MKSATLLLLAGLLSASAQAADNAAPYAGQQTRAIKALSEDDIAALRNGEGLGMAKAAELNGYPGPAHVLALAPQLELTARQKQEVTGIFDRMSAGAKPLGAEVIEKEQALDRLFASGDVTPGGLAVTTAAIGELQARLRAVHLIAHLETRAVLNADQIARYQKLRGYGQGDDKPAHHHRHG